MTAISFIVWFYVILSIPLHGFTAPRAAGTAVTPRALSIPLHGFPALTLGAPGAQGWAFNSIAWILLEPQRGAGEWGGILSIPLHGFTG